MAPEGAARAARPQESTRGGSAAMRVCRAGGRGSIAPLEPYHDLARRAGQPRGDAGVIDLVEGKVVGAKYRLERELARGGMGSVWVARHLQLDCSVAVKFMDPESASYGPARLRFEREAKAAAQLRTPHVVQVYDHGVDDDTPYIVMELLDGEDLGARLKRQHRLTLPLASAILDQLAKGLQRAHAIGIVHRDLKPGNVFLAKGEDGDLVKILDFGIAKAVGTSIADEATKTGQLVGSPHYMSPEQAKGAKAIDHRSDLWSLGVILYRSITGQRPFAGEAVGELIVAICTAPVPAPSRLVPHLPQAIDGFFDRALARDPGRRFQSAREMAAAFAVIAVDATGTGWPRAEVVSSTAVELSTAELVPVAAGRPESADPSMVRLNGTRLDGTLTLASGSVGAPAPRRRPAALWAAAACGVLAVIGGAVASFEQTSAAPAVVASPASAPPSITVGETPPRASAASAVPTVAEAEPTRSASTAGPTPSARRLPVNARSQAAAPVAPRPGRPAPRPLPAPSSTTAGSDLYRER
jgi:serine/threonine-protein kinase